MKQQKVKPIWKIMLFCVLVFGIIARLLWFGVYPMEPNRDEAALGYNAYALSVTGKDEWGTSWPVTFRSFGDYKLAGYVYSLLPFVKMFGLSLWVTRLPSLLAGITLCALMYVFVTRLGWRKEVALFSSFALGGSFWALHYSKVGFEANLGLAFFVGALVIALDKKVTVLKIFSSSLLIFFSLLTYNAPLLLLPGVLFLGFLTKLFDRKTLAAIFVGGALAAVLVYPATKGKTGISLFTDAGVDTVRRERRVEHQGSLLWRLYTRKEVYYPLQVAKKYIAEFSPQFLIWRGGANPWHQAPHYAHMGYGLYALALLGLTSLILQKKKDTVTLFFLGLVALAPLPAAITVDAPHATRSLFLFFTLAVLAGLGLSLFWKKSRTLLAFVALFILLETSLYLWNYKSFAAEANPGWNSGLKESLQKAEQETKGTEHIAIIGDTNYSYVFPLFYRQISPETFRSTVQIGDKDTINFAQVKGFDKYRFYQSAGEATERLKIFQEGNRYSLQVGDSTVQ